MSDDEMKTEDQAETQDTTDQTEGETSSEAEENSKVVSPIAGMSQRDAIERFGDVEIQVDAVLGTVSMPIEQFLKLSRGAIMELDQSKDDDVILRVHGVDVAHGEISLEEENVNIQLKNIAFKNKMYSLDR